MEKVILDNNQHLTPYGLSCGYRERKVNIDESTSCYLSRTADTYHVVTVGYTLVGRKTHKSFEHCKFSNFKDARDRFDEICKKHGLQEPYFWKLQSK